jgi:hypothetical protein
MGKLIWLASYPEVGQHMAARIPAQSDAQSERAVQYQPAHRLYAERCPDELVSDVGSTTGPADLEEEIAALRPRMHEAMTRAHPDTIFVKTHNALVEDRGTPMITMEYTAGAIYVIRNPLDVVISYADHYGLTLDQAIAAMGDAGAAVGKRGDPLLRALWLLVRARDELDASTDTGPAYCAL